MMQVEVYTDTKVDSEVSTRCQITLMKLNAKHAQKEWTEREGQSRGWPKRSCIDELILFILWRHTSLGSRGVIVHVENFVLVLDQLLCLLRLEALDSLV